VYLFGLTNHSVVDLVSGMEVKDVDIDPAKLEPLQMAKHAEYIGRWASGEAKFVLAYHWCCSWRCHCVKLCFLSIERVLLEV
jgi:hypothetical protein